MTEQAPKIEPGRGRLVYDKQRRTIVSAPLPSNEQRYYDALKAIARDYMTPDQMARDAKNIGLSPAEYVEMAYENIQDLAKRAIHRKRRPAQ